ncbi:Cadherin-13 [Varanus komodoensis]|nr:Cadherin-13 [Varanus komodoensis]
MQMRVDEKVPLRWAVVFDDCQGNQKLNFEVSNPEFKVKPNGGLVALRNLTDAGGSIFIHARSAQAEDTAEVFIVGRKERHGSLKSAFVNNLINNSWRPDILENEWQMAPVFSVLMDNWGKLNFAEWDICGSKAHDMVLQLSPQFDRFDSVDGLDENLHERHGHNPVQR